MWWLIQILPLQSSRFIQIHTLDDLWNWRMKKKWSALRTKYQNCRFALFNSCNKCSMFTHVSVCTYMWLYTCRFVKVNCSHVSGSTKAASQFDTSLQFEAGFDHADDKMWHYGLGHYCPIMHCTKVTRGAALSCIEMYFQVIPCADTSSGSFPVIDLLCAENQMTRTKRLGTQSVCWSNKYAWCKCSDTVRKYQNQMCMCRHGCSHQDP